LQTKAFYCLFDFQLDRSGQGPRQFLGEFAGILQTDGYAGYGTSLTIRTNLDLNELIRSKKMKMTLHQIANLVEDKDLLNKTVDLVRNSTIITDFQKRNDNREAFINAGKQLAEQLHQLQSSGGIKPLEVGGGGAATQGARLVAIGSLVGAIGLATGQPEAVLAGAIAVAVGSFMQT
jgi:hypothetical protein